MKLARSCSNLLEVRHSQQQSSGILTAILYVPASLICPTVTSFANPMRRDLAIEIREAIEVHQAKLPEAASPLPYLH